MRRKEFALFWKKFATMLSSGVPLVRTLDTMRLEHAAAALGPVLERVIEDLKAGERLSTCLEAHPATFGRDVIDVIRGGESQGRLDEVAAVVAREVEAGVLSAPEDLEDAPAPAPPVKEEGPTVRELFDEALRARASDVHVDGLLREGRIVGSVRFRIDGLLRETHVLPKTAYARLLSDLKAWAGMDVGEKRLPQDGGLDLELDGQHLRLRVTTGPGLHGETACCRILRKQSFEETFADPERIFPEEELRERLFEIARRPYGLVLCVGPTGSGKTTTAYALLARQNTETCKVVSVEDPVELVLPGVQQVALRPAIGLSVAPALRWVARLDPDVIFCDEIRDAEAGELLLQLALTGHLVLSQLHVQDGLAAIARLLDMGLEPYLLGDALQAVVSQRLVRRLCPACRRPSAEGAERLAELGGRATEGPVYEAAGCDACEGTGYRGRRAIYELLEVDDTLRSLLHRGGDRGETKAWLESSKTPRLIDGGLALVRAGETSLAEVLRVCPRRAS